MKITSQEDFWAGVMFIVFGATAIFISQDYPFGTTSRMGPGYFPTWIGIILVVLGGFIALSGFKNVGEGVSKFAWKAMILLGLAFSIFGWGIDHIGFVPAMAAMIVLSSAAGQDFRPKEVILVMIGLIIGSWALFIKGLDLLRPIYRGTAYHGHFGRAGFPWESTDKAAALKKAVARLGGAPVAPAPVKKGAQAKRVARR